MSWKAIAITIVGFLLALGLLVLIAMLIPTNMK